MFFGTDPRPGEPCIDLSRERDSPDGVIDGPAGTAQDLRSLLTVG